MRREKEEGPKAPILGVIDGGDGGDGLTGCDALGEARQQVLAIAMRTTDVSARQALRQIAAELHLRVHAARLAGRARLS